MTVAYHVSTVLSAVLFLFYGFACLYFDGMAEEFERYGLSRFRRLTGLLEVLGALGLLVGYVFPVVAVLAAGGLCALMFLGTLTRLRVRDGIAETAPAFILMLVNGWICWTALGR